MATREELNIRLDDECNSYVANLAPECWVQIGGLDLYELADLLTRVYKSGQVSGMRAASDELKLLKRGV